MIIPGIPDLAWTDVPSFYLEELNIKVSEVHIKVVQGLIAQRGSVNETQRMILYEKIFNQVETGCENMLSTFHSCLYSFAESYPIEVLNIIEKKCNINDSK